MVPSPILFYAEETAACHSVMSSSPCSKKFRKCFSLYRLIKKEMAQVGSVLIESRSSPGPVLVQILFSIILELSLWKKACSLHR